MSIILLSGQFKLRRRKSKVVFQSLFFFVGSTAIKIFIMMKYVCLLSLFAYELHVHEKHIQTYVARNVFRKHWEDLQLSISFPHVRTNRKAHTARIFFQYERHMHTFCYCGAYSQLSKHGLYSIERYVYPKTRHTTTTMFL